LEIKDKHYIVESNEYGLLDKPETTFRELEVKLNQKVLVEIMNENGIWPKDHAASLELMDASNVSESPPKHEQYSSLRTLNLDSDEEDEPVIFGRRDYENMDPRMLNQMMRRMMNESAISDPRVIMRFGGMRSTLKTPEEREQEELKKALQLSLQEAEKQKELDQKKKDLEIKIKSEQEEIQKFYENMNLKSSTTSTPKIDVAEDFGEEEDLFDQEELDELEFDEEDGEEGGEEEIE